MERRRTKRERVEQKDWTSKIEGDLWRGGIGFELIIVRGREVVDKC